MGEEVWGEIVMFLNVEVFNLIYFNEFLLGELD